MERFDMSVPAVLVLGALARSASAAVASTFTAPAAACVVRFWCPRQSTDVTAHQPH